MTDRSFALLIPDKHTRAQIKYAKKIYISKIKGEPTNYGIGLVIGGINYSITIDGRILKSKY